MLEKSNINSDNWKKIILKAVEKTLEECSSQHEANIMDGHAPYCYYDPKSLNMKFEFIFKDSNGNKMGTIYCNPIISF